MFRAKSTLNMTKKYKNEIEIFDLLLIVDGVPYISQVLLVTFCLWFVVEVTEVATCLHPCAN